MQNFAQQPADVPAADASHANRPKKRGAPKGARNTRNDVRDSFPPGETNPERRCQDESPGPCWREREGDSCGRPRWRPRPLRPILTPADGPSRPAASLGMTGGNHD